MKELDVVHLRDGRTGTVLEVLEYGKAYLTEITDKKGNTFEITVIDEQDISEVIFPYS
ncbi:MAG: DUF4926 domain-containing protein [Ruminococcus bromii]|nr:DUF4926 domain-containing protein [Ruminococcus bromii]